MEGAANEDGRTPSIWDTFAHSHEDVAGKILENIVNNQIKILKWLITKKK